ncbi:MAG: hypothetical protein HKL90_00435 [Elusimicrobia bacterium]|nr:hypothetical protein [Elusimicrobiota bacterium]
MSAAGSLAPTRERAFLAAVALAARVGFVAAASAATGVAWRDLALRYDGHCYILIASTIPRLYVGAPPLFPALRDPAFLTGWFPLYPALIRAASGLTGGLRAAALVVSWVSSAAATVLFHRLAGRFSSRPGLMTLVFIFFPPMWLVAGSLGFVEPVFVCAAIAAVLAALEDRPWACAAAAAVAVLAQKWGLIVPAIVLLIVLDRGGLAEARRFRPVLLSLVPLAALQAYLGAVFHDPFVNLRVARENFGGTLLGFPFASLLRGLTHPLVPSDIFGRVCLIANAVVYSAVAVVAWRRGVRAQRPLLIWLTATLSFVFCLGGGDYEAYNFPRFLLLAAPAAILLLEPFAPRKPSLAALAAPLAILPFIFGIIEVARTEAILRRSGLVSVLAAESAVLR